MASHWQTIAGISLQLSTGFIIILQQLFQPLLKSVGEGLGIIAGHPAARWKRVIIYGLVGATFGLVTIYIYIAVTDRTMDILARTFGAALAPIVVLALSYTVYLHSLEWTTRRLAICKPSRYTIDHQSDNYGHTLRDSNIILLVASLAVTVGLGYLAGHLVSGNSTVAIGVLLIVALGFSVYPLLALSCLYIVMLFILNTLGLLIRRTTIFWALCLVLWTLGGGFLLWGALQT
jgi:hypothetical protein